MNLLYIVWVTLYRAPCGLAYHIDKLFYSVILTCPSVGRVGKSSASRFTSKTTVRPKCVQLYTRTSAMVMYPYKYPPGGPGVLAIDNKGYFNWRELVSWVRVSSVIEFPPECMPVPRVGYKAVFLPGGYTPCTSENTP